MKVDGWSAAGAVINPSHKYQDGALKNEDMFQNAKAQAWWLLRDRFLETTKAVNGEPYDPEKIISLSASIEELRELKSELSQITYEYTSTGKILINKAPAGHESPNRADSLMIAFVPGKAPMWVAVYGPDYQWERTYR